MIYLDSTLNLQMDASGAAATTAPEAHVQYKDQVPRRASQPGAQTIDSGALTETQGGYQRSVMNGTTDIVMCDSPPQGTRRAIENITWNNLDTAAVTVRIWTDDGTTERELFGPRSVASGAILFYEHGSGWGVI